MGYKDPCSSHSPRHRFAFANQKPKRDQVCYILSIVPKLEQGKENGQNRYR